MERKTGRAPKTAIHDLKKEFLNKASLLLLNSLDSVAAHSNLHGNDLTTLPEKAFQGLTALLTL